MVRGLVLGTLAFGAAFAAERRFGAIGKDVARYNTIREMSGDPPLFRQLLSMATRAASKSSLMGGGTSGGAGGGASGSTAGAQSGTADGGAAPVGKVGEFIGSLAKDVARYVTIRSM